MQLYGDGVFQGIGFSLLEGNQLHADALQLSQLLLAELLQEDLGVGLHQALVAACPAARLPVHVVEREVIVAVVDEIGLVAALLEVFRVGGQEGQIDVEPLSLGGLGRFLLGLWLGLRLRGGLYRPWRLGAVGAVYLHLLLAYHDALPDQGGHLEAILILHHHLIFPSETADDTSSNAVEETYLISNIHRMLFLMFYNLGANLLKNPHMACLCGLHPSVSEASLL